VRTKTVRMQPVRFRAVGKTTVLNVGEERLRIAWTNSGIAAVERETLHARRALERRMRMKLVETPPPPVLRRFLSDAAKGKADDAPIDLSWARDFEREVLVAARRIPYGETKSYSWLAREARRPLAVRAAASAMARNPLWLLVPCHRVIYSDGRLGPYGNGAVGQARKRALLEREGVKLARPLGAKEKRSRRGARTTRR
jgi:O-6-methylguanine DNA methyltransferase